MALLRGKLLAGALFAGALFGVVQQVEQVEQQTGGGHWKHLFHPFEDATEDDIRRMVEEKYQAVENRLRKPVSDDHVETPVVSSPAELSKTPGQVKEKPFTLTPRPLANPVMARLSELSKPEHQHADLDNSGFDEARTRRQRAEEEALLLILIHL